MECHQRIAMIPASSNFSIFAAMAGFFKWLKMKKTNINYSQNPCFAICIAKQDNKTL